MGLPSSDVAIETSNYVYRGTEKRFPMVWMKKLHGNKPWLSEEMNGGALCGKTSRWSSSKYVKQKPGKLGKLSFKYLPTSWLTLRPNGVRTPGILEIRCQPVIPVPTGTGGVQISVYTLIIHHTATKPRSQASAAWHNQIWSKLRKVRRGP